MKYIKAYELLNNFNAGDYVVCINNYNAIELEFKKVFKVISVSSGIIHFRNKGDYVGYKKERFRLASPDEIEKYEIELSTKKYNL